MRYGSLCSGIEAATCAWHPLGWRPQFFSEIDKAASRFLAHTYPDTPNLGDMTKFQDWPDHAIDLLVGGTPCQSFSVAGLRKGLADPRGNLMLTYLAIADRYRPKWLVWENVPGVLSSDGGRDFASFLGGLGQLGYGWAYRVLDAQYVRVESHPRAVPQRRRRVFVVGYLGDWRRAAAVLFDRESLLGNPPPRRQSGEGATHDVAGSLVSSGRGVERPGETRGQDPVIGVISLAHGQAGAEVAVGHGPTPTCNHEAPIVAHALRREGHDASEDGTVRGTPLVAVAYRTTGNDGVYETGDIVHALTTNSDPNSHVVAIQERAVAFDMRGREGGAQFEGPHETANIRSASGGSSRSYVAQQWAVRRLTPLECERLQGFPDGYTAETLGGKTQADGVRYKQLGNSMAVNCMRWIGERIDAVAKIEVHS